MSRDKNRRHEAMLEQGMHSGNTDAKFDPPPAPFDTATKCKQRPNGQCRTEAACNSVRRCYYAATRTRKTPDRFASIAGGRL